MQLDSFDYHLPNNMIAVRPANPRSSSRMLKITPDHVGDFHILDLPDFMSKGDIIVCNNTKVIPSFITGICNRTTTSFKVEVLLANPLSQSCWTALAYPGHKLKSGDRINFPNGIVGNVYKHADTHELSIDFIHDDGTKINVIEYMYTSGTMPIPPYIRKHRLSDEQDTHDYQSIFANKEGAIAAPTASLHFDESLLQKLKNCGVIFSTVTLHVGQGTFMPIRTNNIHDFTMHKEWGELPASTVTSINEAKQRGNRILAVGTTVLRVLETAFQKYGSLNPWQGTTDLFIYPGYKINNTDMLLTNFHAPKSTPFILACAIMGTDTMKSAYYHAINNKYRFLSYGDATLLIP